MKIFWFILCAVICLPLGAQINTTQADPADNSDLSLAPNGYSTFVRLTGGSTTPGMEQDETVIYFDTNATMGFDPSLDALKIIHGDSLVPNMYTKTIPTENFSINAIPPLDTSEVVIPLLFVIDIGGPFVINATEIVNIPTGYNIFLEDSLLNVLQDLELDPSYVFTMQTSMNPYRFYLRFKPVVTSSTPIDPNACRIFSDGSSIFFISDKSASSDISIFNMNGQCVYHFNGNTEPNHIVSENLPSGIYFAVMRRANKTFSQKVFLK